MNSARMAWLWCGLSLCACGYYSTTPPDSGAADRDGSDGTDADGGIDFDQSPEEFCRGPAKARFGAGLHLAEAVTSEELIMDCCTGAIFVLHLPEAAGTDLVVSIRAFAISLDPGTYELVGSSDGPGMASVLRGSTCCDGESAGVSGTLEVSREGDPWEAPTFMTLCGRVDQEGSLQGTRLWFDRVPVAPVSWWGRWGLWLLEDPEVSASTAAGLPLDSLELAAEPLIDLGSLSWYGWDAHTLAWGSWHNSTELRNRLPQVGVHGLPFVVVADGARIYLGAFYTLASSVMLDLPVIAIDGPGFLEDRITIEPRPSAAPGADARADPRIREVLDEAGKLAP